MGPQRFDLGAICLVRRQRVPGRLRALVQVSDRDRRLRDRRATPCLHQPGHRRHRAHPRHRRATGDPVRGQTGLLARPDRQGPGPLRSVGPRVLAGDHVDLVRGGPLECGADLGDQRMAELHPAQHCHLGVRHRRPSPSLSLRHAGDARLGVREVGPSQGTVRIQGGLEARSQAGLDRPSHVLRRHRCSDVDRSHRRRDRVRLAGGRLPRLRGGQCPGLPGCPGPGPIA
jgi:hypothetical protein